MSELHWVIEDLSDYPQWHSEVVAWHHAEWLRNYDGELSEQNVAEALADRMVSMQQHMRPDTIPSTFIAHNNKRAIGSVSLIYYPFSREPTRVWLTNLFVDHSFQKKGIGTELLSYAEAYSKKNNISELSLYTFDAKDYYLKRAWTWLSKGELHGREVDIFSKKPQRFTE